MDKREEEEEEEEEEIVIVGGGIAGLATAVALKRVRFHSLVLESHSELRTSGLALAVFPNGWSALRALGVSHKLTSVYKEADKASVTNLETGATQDLRFGRTPITRGEQGVVTVHRKALLEALAEELPPDSIRFSSKLISIATETRPDSSKINVLHLADGTVMKAKVVIGCDGVHSTVAQWLGLSQPIRSARAAFRGLSVFPEGHEFAEMRQYIGRGMRAAFVSLNSKELHWFLIHYPSLENDMPTSPELILKEVTKNIAKDFPSDFLTVVERTDLSTVMWAPFLFRLPWNVAFGPTQNGNVTVVGDAMHPMDPDLGQGGCSSLEDAVILARCLSLARNDTDHSSQEWSERGLKRYVEERRWRVTWLIVASWLSGWVQQVGGADQKWWSVTVRWFRDRFFYKCVYPWIFKYALQFDSGDLSTSEQ